MQTGQRVRARSKAIAACRLVTLLYLEGAPTEANTPARTALTLAGDVRSARLGADLRLMARAAGAAPRDTFARRFGPKPTFSRSP